MAVGKPASVAPPSKPTASALRGVGWDDVTPLLPKVLAGLLAGGVLVFNGWFAGIFNGGQPYHVVSWQFPLLLYIQAVLVATAMTSVPGLFYDVAGGVVAGVLVVGITGLAGAVSGKFDLLQFIAQLVVASWAGATSLQILATRRQLKQRRELEPRVPGSEVADQPPHNASADRPDST